MYWTSEADLSGFIFGNKADWLFGEQESGMYAKEKTLKKLNNQR